MSLSARQEHIIRFIRQYLRDNHFPPTIREIGEAVGISSTSVVNYNLNALEKKGIIERDQNVSRGLRLIDEAFAVPRPRQSAGIPLLGYIAAGEPIRIPESGTDFSLLGEETIEIPELESSTEGLFALRVRGNSMIDALINDGDIVVLKSQPDAENGQMVAAWIADRRETTLKRFYREGKQVRLQPANPTMGPMYFPAENVQVNGKVVMVIRHLD